MQHKIQLVMHVVRNYENKGTLSRSKQMANQHYRVMSHIEREISLPQNGSTGASWTPSL